MYVYKNKRKRSMGIGGDRREEGGGRDDCFRLRLRLRLTCVYAESSAEKSRKHGVYNRKDSTWCLQTKGEAEPTRN